MISRGDRVRLPDRPDLGVGVVAGTRDGKPSVKMVQWRNGWGHYEETELEKVE